MWNVSSTWLAALSQPHGRYTRLEAWFNGVKVTSIQPESGSVQVTARNRVRRTLTAVVPEGYWPTSSTSPLAPYGWRVKVFQGITGANGVLIGSEVPVFAGRVEMVDRVRRAGKVTVTAVDPFADVNDLMFEQPRAAVAGGSVVGHIQTMVGEAVGGAGVQDQTASIATVPAGVVWDQDRGAAIDSLAASIGAEAYFLPDGVTCIVRLIPQLGGTPVWSLVQGVNSTVIRDEMTKSRTDVANRIVVRAQQPGQTPILVTVTDIANQSPTRYGGPYGRVVRYYTNPLITTAAQAQAAGAARLARTIGITRTRQVDVVPNPALEAGDLLSITTDEGVEQHIADQITVPLGVDQPMTIQTRSTGTSVS